MNIIKKIIEYRHRKVFKCFYKNLMCRFENKGNLSVSEDCVRYDLFCALSRIYKPYQIYLECHDDSLPNKEIDCVIKRKNGDIGFEIKFLRDIKSKKLDTTSTMGVFINDWYRVLRSNLSKKYIVLVSDKVMVNYIKRHTGKKEFSWIYDKDILDINWKSESDIHPGKNVQKKITAFSAQPFQMKRVLNFYPETNKSNLWVAIWEIIPEKN